MTTPTHTREPRIGRSGKGHVGTSRGSPGLTRVLGPREPLSGSPSWGDRPSDPVTLLQSDRETRGVSREISGSRFSFIPGQFVDRSSTPVTRLTSNVPSLLIQRITTDCVVPTRRRPRTLTLAPGPGPSKQGRDEKYCTPDPEERDRSPQGGRVTTALYESGD